MNEGDSRRHDGRSLETVSRVKSRRNLLDACVIAPPFHRGKHGEGKGEGGGARDREGLMAGAREREAENGGEVGETTIWRVQKAQNLISAPSRTQYTRLGIFRPGRDARSSPIAFSGTLTIIRSRPGANSLTRVYRCPGRC